MTTEAVPVPGVGVTVEYNVPATMRDGITLAADVYRPEGEGPWPVILMRLPYDKTSAENISYTDPSWYARQGYLVVVQDVRGTAASDGEFIPFQHEAEDGYDTIEWAARLPEWVNASEFRACKVYFTTEEISDPKCQCEPIVIRLGAEGWNIRDESNCRPTSR